MKQARFLTDHLNRLGLQLDRVIYIDISQQESLKRLLKRRRRLFPGSKITHDTEGKINRRLKTYRSEEKKLLSYFDEQGLVSAIKGQQPINKVFRDILDSLKGRHASSLPITYDKDKD